MDLGKSLNPSVDVGQIEGAFVQGMGLFTIEELVWGDSDHPWMRPGWLYTRGPGTYKIPSFNDVPIDFRVSLLQDAVNPLVRCDYFSSYSSFCCWLMSDFMVCSFTHVFSHPLSFQEFCRGCFCIVSAFLLI